jgi:hypothetical protein
MFRSKVRAIVIPQYEHGRLAGTFALFWGNKEFEKPVIDFSSFVTGVALHDWHYGVIDNLAIGEAAEADWEEIVRKGGLHWFDDPITDIVAKFHLRRLLRGHDSPKTDEMMSLINGRITERLSQTDFSFAQFVWADKITAFCDQLAFDFCFEETVSGLQAVFSNVNAEQETILTYEIRSGGQIVVDPWPFSVEKFDGIITGYHEKGYPEVLTPEIIPFRCARIE